MSFGNDREGKLKPIVFNFREHTVFPIELITAYKELAEL